MDDRLAIGCLLKAKAQLGLIEYGWTAWPGLSVTWTLRVALLQPDYQELV